jgi:hypothetical protein
MTEPDDCIQIFVPLTVRRQNGRPKILPPADYLPSEDRTQDPHILRAIGTAWGWRRRMERGQAATIQDIAAAESVTPAYVGRMLKLAYLAPAVLEKLLIARVPPTVSVKELAEVAELPWAEQAIVVFADQ